jgi:hypothetical protein
MKDHSDHTDLKNFTSFQEAHKKFLAMVENGDLRPPSVLEQAVDTLAKALDKKVTKYLGSFQDELIKYSLENTSRKIKL